MYMSFGLEDNEITLKSREWKVAHVAQHEIMHLGEAQTIMAIDAPSTIACLSIPFREVAITSQILYTNCQILLQFADHDVEDFLQVFGSIFRFLRNALPYFAVSGFAEYALRYNVCSFLLRRNFSPVS